MIWLAAAMAGTDAYGDCEDVTWFEQVEGLPAKGNSLGLNLNDVDGDGDNDVIVATGPARVEHALYYPGETLLYRNDGDLQFTEVGAEWGLDNRCEDRSPLFGDLDGDGAGDVYMTVNGHNRLFRNDGYAGFVDVTASSGATAHPGWGHTGLLLDYDQDGQLDVFFTNGPEDGSGHNVLLRNQGDGTFVDVTEDAGVAGSPSGKGACVLDADGDGLLDLFVTTGRGLHNELFINRGDGTFVDEAAERGVADPGKRFGVGAVCADLDADGDADIALVTHDKSWGGNLLYRNDQGRFVDIAQQTGFAEFIDGHGLAAEDLDLDGDLDLVLSGIGKPPVVFRNDGDWVLTRLCRGGGVVHDGGLTWAVAAGDLDGDAYPEVLISHGLGRRPRANGLYRNVNRGANWLTVEAVGASNPSQLGARVQVRVGEHLQTRWVGSWSSFDSQGPLPLTFGLGAETMVDEVLVHFTDGSRQVLTEVPANQKLVVVADSRADDDHDGVPDEWDICPLTVLGQMTDADGCAPMQGFVLGVAGTAPAQDVIASGPPTFTWEGTAQSAVVQVSTDGTWGVAGRWDFGPVEGNTLTLSEEQWAALPKEQTLLWRVATWSEEGEGLSTVRRLHPAVETSLVTVPEGANIFSPAHIVVDVGTTVTFWNDPVSAGNLQNEIHDIQLYSASGSVVSPMSDVDGGGAFTWTFDEPGVWSSVCHRHSGVPGGIESLMAPRVEGAFKCMAATVTVR